MKWVLTTRDIHTTAEADTAEQAFDALRAYPAEDFGLVVTACPAGQSDSNAIPIRTSHLMGRWGRLDAARAFIQRAIAEDLPDTTDRDIPAAIH